ncbi:hypothetical protein NDU88_003851, partial [Pleurodeles waltl]
HSRIHSSNQRSHVQKCNFASAITIHDTIDRSVLYTIQTFSLHAQLTHRHW